jgi:hypothetical protein
LLIVFGHTNGIVAKSCKGHDAQERLKKDQRRTKEKKKDQRKEKEKRTKEKKKKRKRKRKRPGLDN